MSAGGDCTAPGQELGAGELEGLSLPREFEARRLKGHASTRRFYRLTTRGDTSAILMVYPDDECSSTAEDIDRFCRSTEWFAAAGVAVPAILQRGSRALVVSDAGDVLLDATAREARPRYYAQAANIIVRIQRAGRRSAPPTPGWALDRKRFEFEFDYLEEHTFGGLLDAPGAADRGRVYAMIIDRLDALPQALCHRDFHSRNLIVRNERVIVVDHQDAMDGPAFYDAVSLLLDNYTDVGERAMRPAIQRLRDELVAPHGLSSTLAVPDWPMGLSPAERQAFALTALQRCLKALGTFGFQIGRAGNDGFAAYVPRTWAHVRRLFEILGWEEHITPFAAVDRLA